MSSGEYLDNDNDITETCKDFPLNPIEPSTSKIIPPQRITIDRSGGSLIWWILAAALTLMIIGVIFMAILFRRREFGYNEWKRRKSLLGTSKVVHNELYNPNALDNETVPPSPAKSKIRKSLFTSSKRKKSTATPPSISSKEYDVSGNENPNAVYAVVKKKSMKKGKLNSSSTSVSENSMSPTPNMANVATESGQAPQPAKSDSASETQFNFLYDSFLKSTANTNRDNTYNHLEPSNGKLGEG
ncbi:uncharacterized protein LOC117342279 [Pecten maximus]|uniref:uncharacterized protein LOC117342279 n=1 Tax=Pecten maximus TaxID=6579 RepID=UPI001458C2F4|nr:uncharacterized protein LOC117342279 [Pecten maximus]